MFPGGHIEPEESFYKSVIREAKEETGLDIKNPKLCGIKQWEQDDASRYIVLLFKSNEYSGTLQSSEEGEVFWIKRDDLQNYTLANGFKEMLEIFENDNLTEFQWVKENDEWVIKIYLY